MITLHTPCITRQAAGQTQSRQLHSVQVDCGLCSSLNEHYLRRSSGPSLWVLRSSPLQSQTEMNGSVMVFIQSLSCVSLVSKKSFHKDVQEKEANRTGTVGHTCSKDEKIMMHQSGSENTGQTHTRTHWHKGFISSSQWPWPWRILESIQNFSRNTLTQRWCTIIRSLVAKASAVRSYGRNSSSSFFCCCCCWE